MIDQVCVLWVEDGGRVECSDHIGAEARAVLARSRGDLPRQVETALGVWMLLDVDTVEEWFGDWDGPIACETCGAPL